MTLQYAALDISAYGSYVKVVFMLFLS